MSDQGTVTITLTLTSDEAQQFVCLMNFDSTIPRAVATTIQRMGYDDGTQGRTADTAIAVLMKTIQNQIRSTGLYEPVDAMLSLITGRTIRYNAAVQTRMVQTPPTAPESSERTCVQGGRWIEEN